MKSNIKEAQEEQSEYLQKIKERNEIQSVLKYSFQHLLSVVRHVGEEHIANKAEYPNSDLNLSLLKFSTFVAKAHPPEPYEEDGKLIIIFV